MTAQELDGGQNETRTIIDLRTQILQTAIQTAVDEVIPPPSFEDTDLVDEEYELAIRTIRFAAKESVARRIAATVRHGLRRPSREVRNQWRLEFYDEIRALGAEAMK